MCGPPAMVDVAFAVAVQDAVLYGVWASVVVTVVGGVLIVLRGLLPD